MCSHGFNIHFGQITPPKGVDALLVAHKRARASGSKRISKGAVPCLIALSDGASEQTKKIGLAYALGSAVPGRGSLRRRFERRPKPIYSANRSFFAAASPRSSRRGSKRSWKPATSRKWRISSAFTS